MSESSGSPIWAWRHPRPNGAQGRCIGRTDLGVDRRRAKRLARRIQRAARHEGLPRIVYTSPLRRCADVGRWLRRWGWAHHIDPALIELDFGRWEGLAWDDVDRRQIDHWCEHFGCHAPGGGESLAQLFERAAVWRAAAAEPRLVVAHAGWMLAMRWLAEARPLPTLAGDWPPPPGYGALWSLVSRFACLVPPLV